MRLAWTVATPDTADPGMLAWRGRLPEIFSELAALGYGGVELMVRDPRELKLAEIERDAEGAGLSVAAVSTGPVRKEDGLSLNAEDEAARRRAVDRALAVVDAAARWKAQVNIGTFRGQLGPERAAGMARAARSLREISEHAAGAGVTVALEPQCRWVSNWLNTAAETVEWMRAWTPDPRILFDVYHAALEEDSIYAALIRNRAHVSYVQLSDSNRLAPGAGGMHFGDVVRVLDALAYTGFLCVECRQEPCSREAARRAAACLIPLIQNPTEAVTR